MLSSKNSWWNQWYVWFSEWDICLLMTLAESTSVINDKSVIYCSLNNNIWDSIDFCRTLSETDSRMHLSLKLYISSATIMDFTSKYLQNIIKTTW